MFTQGQDSSNRPDARPDPESQCPYRQTHSEDTSPLKDCRYTDPSIRNDDTQSKTPVLREVLRVSDSYWHQFSNIKKDFPEYLKHCREQYGDVYRLSPVPFVGLTVVSDPDLVHEILVSNASDYTKSATTARMIGKFLGKGVLLAEGADHREQRRLLQPAFAGKQLHSYVPEMINVTENWIQGISKNETIDFQEACKSLTLRVVVQTLFGTLLQASEERLVSCMHTFEEAISGRFKSLPIPDWIPTRKNREQKAAIQEMATCIQGIIEERRGSLSEGKEPGDLLGRLLYQQQFGESGYQINDTFIEDQLKTFFFAGHETISRVLTWTIAMLEKHERWGELVKNELRETAPGDLDLPLTEAFLKETMRLYPPAWVFDRSNTSDQVIDGHLIKKGTTLYISPYVIHRDERWFQKAEEFLPERFIKGSGYDTFPQKAYIPFGGGPRICIGAAFAMLEAKAILQCLYQELEIKRTDNEPLQHMPGATLGIKEGLKVRFEKRD